VAETALKLVRPWPNELIVNDFQSLSEPIAGSIESDFQTLLHLNLPTCYNSTTLTLSLQDTEVELAKYHRNTGKVWTPSQDRQLREMARENTPTRVIGLKLGRTEDAVRTRASDKGISLKPTNQSPYNRWK
jgi:hypothetical protein